MRYPGMAIVDEGDHLTLVQWQELVVGVDLLVLRLNG
jgi:hypothetical protein